MNNTLKLFVPLLTIYCMNAADPRDARKAAEIIKDKGKITTINQEVTYYLDTKPADYMNIESTLRYNDFFKGESIIIRV